MKYSFHIILSLKILHFSDWNVSSGYLVKSGAEIFLNFYFINTIALLILELVFKVIEVFENEDQPQ